MENNQQKKIIQTLELTENTPQPYSSMYFTLGSWHWCRSSGDPSVQANFNARVNSRRNGKINFTFTLSTKGEYSSSYWGWRWVVYIRVNGVKILTDTEFKPESASMTQTKSWDVTVDVPDSATSVDLWYDIDDRRGVIVSTNGDSNGYMHTTLSGSALPPSVYTITFNANGGSPNSSKNITPGNAIGSLPTPSRSLYTFTGWYTSANGGSKISTSTIPTSNTTYYAHWSRNTCTVTFNPNGGTTPEKTRIVYQGNAIGSLPEPSKAEYAFVRWYNSSGNTITSSTIINSNQTLTAEWKKLIIKTFYLEGYKSGKVFYCQNGSKSGNTVYVTQGKYS